MKLRGYSLNNGMAALLRPVLLISLAWALCALQQLSWAVYVHPVVYPRISSTFGQRLHPIHRVVRNHSGVDLAAPIGTPVRAVTRGRVVFSDLHGGYGKLLVIDHGRGITSHYGHLDKIFSEIGQLVNSGEIIAEVGNSGESTGPHLHFELRREGTPLDPLKYIPGLGVDGRG